MGKKSCVFHCFPLSKQTCFFWWYVSCTCAMVSLLLSVSKWLLYRQRKALCCEMLLRHNWVRLDESACFLFFFSTEDASRCF